MPLTLTLDFEDSHYLYHTAVDAMLLRDEEQAGRFNYAGKPRPENTLPDLLIAMPDYDEGSLMWCASAGDALLLKKIHEAEGHTAVVLVDKFAENHDEVSVVLSSWNMREGETPLSETPVVAEIVLHGEEDDDLDELRTLAFTAIRQVGEVLGEPNVEDHGDHFHLTVIFEAPGLAVRDIVATTAKAVSCAVGYSIITEA